MPRKSFCSPLLLPPLVIAVLCGCGGTGIPTGDVSGQIMLNGQPAPGVEVSFVPKSKMRPSVAVTDAQGRYEAQFVSSQSGVVLGPCVAQFAIYRNGNYMHNYLPSEFNENAAENPELCLDIPEEGIVFNYDIKYTGEIPPYVPE